MNEEDLAAANRVADVVLGKFDSLPSKCKPLAHSDNKTSWTVLSGIVLERGMNCIEATTVFLTHFLWLSTGQALM